MNRRDLITLLGGAAAWPVTAHAQPAAGRMKRIGVLMGYAESDSDGKAQLSEFFKELARLGWTDGNLRIEQRWTAGDLNRARMLAKELVDLQPDAVLAHTTPSTAALLLETRTIPIAFVTVSDPIGSRFISGFARPGGNITGFINLEPTMGGKWLELLMEIAPGVEQVTALFNPDTAPYVESYYLPSFEAAARSFKLMPIIARVRNDAEIGAAIASIGHGPRGGLVVPPDSFTFVHRAAIISQAAQDHVPAVYAVRGFATDGGLLSYGTDETDLFRRAAPYIDRILKGEKPGDLPVQVPTKFELLINLKTAKAFGLDVPASMQLLANEVIE